MFERAEYHLSDTLSSILKDESVSSEIRTAIVQNIDESISEYNKLRQDHDGPTAAFNFAVATEEETKNSERVYTIQEKKSPSCRKGCAFCCHYRIDITDDEAELMIQAAKETNVAFDVDALQAQSQHDNNWHALTRDQRRCPMLNANNECSIYQYRPSACRTLLVATPANQCDTENGIVDVGRILSISASIIHAATINARPSGQMAKMLLQKLDR